MTEKYQLGTSKEASKASNIGEIWNPVCCHGDIIDYRIILSTPTTRVISVGTLDTIFHEIDV